MLPATRGLAEYLRQTDSPNIGDYEDAPSHQDPYDPQILSLKIKWRRQMELVRQMLEDSGYSDLAKMTTLTKRDLNTDGE